MLRTDWMHGTLFRSLLYLHRIESIHENKLDYTWWNTIERVLCAKQTKKKPPQKEKNVRAHENQTLNLIQSCTAVAICHHDCFDFGCAYARARHYELPVHTVNCFELVALLLPYNTNVNTKHKNNTATAAGSLFAIIFPKWKITFSSYNFHDDSVSITELWTENNGHWSLTTYIRRIGRMQQQHNRTTTDELYKLRLFVCLIPWWWQARSMLHGPREIGRECFRSMPRQRDRGRKNALGKSCGKSFRNLKSSPGPLSVHMHSVVYYRNTHTPHMWMCRFGSLFYVWYIHRLTVKRGAARAR